jgi:hypothetical protein
MRENQQTVVLPESVFACLVQSGIDYIAPFSAALTSLNFSHRYREVREAPAGTAACR